MLRSLRLRGVFKTLQGLFKKKEHRYDDIVDLLGFHPKNFQLYRTALRHSSVIYTKRLDLESNERLEFLGDSVLDLVVSEVLYYKFPDRNEGELTKLRVKLVNRSFLNEVSVKMGFPSLLHQYVGKKKELQREQHNIYGNALEAIIGAIYLDMGIKQAATFINDKVLAVGREAQLEDLLSSEKDYKSRIISWAQKQGKGIDFTDELSANPNVFRAAVKFEGTILGTGEGKRKKAAHQKAAEESINHLKRKGRWKD